MNEPKPMPSYWSLAEEVTHLHGCLDKLKAENTRLRELVKRYHRLVTNTDELWSWQSVYAELQELGIEVIE